MCEQAHGVIPCNANVENLVVAYDERAQLVARVDSLERRRRRVIRDHYFGGRPLSAIARDLGVSNQRASQIHNAALKALRGAYAVA